MCPKHEVELIEFEPTRSDRSAERVAIQWVTVCTFQNPCESEPLRIRLEAEGIPTFINGERMASHLLGHGARGGVELLVPIEDVQEARVILAQSWRIDLDDDPDDEWDDSDDERLAPENLPTCLHKSAKFLKIAVGIGFLIPIVALILREIFDH